MKKRLASILALVTAFSLLVAPVAYAGSWMKDNIGWWYNNGNGTYQNNGWFQDTDGTYYYFNKEGYMLSNTTTPDGYKVDANGAWISNESHAALSVSQKETIQDIIWVAYTLQINNTVAQMSSDEISRDIMITINNGHHAFGIYDSAYHIGYEDGYAIYDLNETLSRFKQEYGVNATAADIKDQYRHIYVQGNTIRLSVADGDYWEYPSLTSISYQGDKLIVGFSADHEQNEYGDAEHYGNGTAVFQKNDNSYFGYTMISYNYRED